MFPNAWGLGGHVPISANLMNQKALFGSVKLTKRAVKSPFSKGGLRRILITCAAANNSNPPCPPLQKGGKTDKLAPMGHVCPTPPSPLRGSISTLREAAPRDAGQPSLAPSARRTRAYACAPGGAWTSRGNLQTEKSFPHLAGCRVRKLLRVSL